MMKNHTSSLTAPWYHLLHLSLGLLLLVGSASSRAQQVGVLLPVEDNPPAPDFSLADTTGTSHTLSDYRGKVVIVNFWASWCAPCRKEMPSMQRAWEQLRDQDVVMLAVNWGDDLPAVERFTASLPPLDFPLVLGGDQAMIDAWEVKGLPTTLVVDPQGHLALRLIGDAEWDSPEIMEQVLALHDGE